MPTDDHHRELGRVCTEFQAIEVRLNFIAWSLISEDQRVGQIITTKMSFKNLCVAIDALISYKQGDEHPQTKEIQEIIKRCNALEQRRNQFIHSFWTEANPDTGMSVRLKLKFAEISENPTKASDVAQLADEMALVKNELNSFIQRNGE